MAKWVLILPLLPWEPVVDTEQLCVRHFSSYLSHNAVLCSGRISCSLQRVQHASAVGEGEKDGALKEGVRNMPPSFKREVKQSIRVLKEGCSSTRCFFSSVVMVSGRYVTSTVLFWWGSKVTSTAVVQCSPSTTGEIRQRWFVGLMTARLLVSELRTEQTKFTICRHKEQA